MNWIKAFLVVVGRGILTALKYVFSFILFLITVGLIASIPHINDILGIILLVLFGITVIAGIISIIGKFYNALIDQKEKFDRGW